MDQPETPQAASVETGLEVAQPQSDPINFEEPVSAADLTAGVADTPEEARPLLTEAQMLALQAEASRDDTKRDFTLKVLAARAKKEDEPAPPPPLAPRVVDQTNAEILEGRRLNAHHAALQARRPSVPPPTAADGKTVAVFRPGDYVPDQKKGQGNVRAQNL